MRSITPRSSQGCVKTLSIMDTLELIHDLQYELKREKDMQLKAELTLEKAQHENLPDYIINYMCEEVVHHEFAVIHIQQKLDALDTLTIKTPLKTTTTIIPPDAPRKRTKHSTYKPSSPRTIEF